MIAEEIRLRALKRLGLEARILGEAYDRAQALPGADRRALQELERALARNRAEQRQWEVA